MRIKYFDIARIYLVVSIFIFPLSSFWPGPSLVLITDVLMILVVLNILLKKRFNHDMKWIIILMALFLFQMVLVMAKYNGNISLFLQTRSIFMYTLIIFFYMYTFSNLDGYNLKKMSHFIELSIKILVAAIIADGIAINFLGMENLFSNVFQSSLGNYGITSNPGFLFPKIPYGLIFGSQHASILSVVGMLWWLPGIKKINTIYLSEYIWFILSFIALVFSLTITAVLTLTIMLLVTLLIILLKKQNSTKLAFIILTPFVISIFFDRLISLFNNILKMRYLEKQYYHNSEILLQLQIDRYFSYMVEQPINAFSKYISEILLGSGTGPSSQQMDIVLEIGFINLIIHFGLVFIGILLLFFSFYMLKSIHFIIRNNIENEENNIIFRLILISLVIVLSLMHYTTFLAPGVKQLFAAAIALSFVLKKNQKRISQKKLLLSQQENSMFSSTAYFNVLPASEV